MAILVWLKRTLRHERQSPYEPQIWHGPPFVGGAADRSRVVKEYPLPDLPAEQLSERFYQYVAQYPAPTPPEE